MDFAEPAEEHYCNWKLELLKLPMRTAERHQCTSAVRFGPCLDTSGDNELVSLLALLDYQMLAAKESIQRFWILGVDVAAEL